MKYVPSNRRGFTTPNWTRFCSSLGCIRRTALACFSFNPCLGDARFRGHTHWHDAIASGPLHAGNHARDLFARDPGRAASRSRERREVRIWTKMDPSSVSGATGISKSELKNQELVVGAWRFELQTSCAQGRRATRLRYAPT